MAMAKAPKQQVQKSGIGIWGSLSLGVLVSLTFWVPHVDAFNISKQVVLIIGTLALVIRGFIHKTQKLSFGLPQIVLLTFFATLIINLLASPNFYQTLVGTQGRNNGFLTYLCFGLIGYSVSQRFKESDISKLLWSLFGLGVVQAFYNLLQLADKDPISWNNPYGFILGTLGNSDFAAALLAICLVATLWLALLKWNQKPLSLGLLMIAAIELYVLFASSVRQSLVLFAFGSSVIIYSQIKERSSKLSLVWVGTVGFAGLVAVLGSLQIGPLTSIMFKESITYRGDYWRAAWRMFMDHPIFGVGLGNYGDYFNQYRDAAQVARRGPAVGSDVAHSMPLDFLAMGGLITGGIYLLLITLSVAYILSNLKKSEGVSHTNTLIVFSLLGCYLLQSLISIDQIGLAIWGWIFIGIAFSYIKRDESTSKDEVVNKAVFATSALVLILSFVLVAVPNWRADSTLKQLATIPFEQQGIDTRAARIAVASKLTGLVPQNNQYKVQASLYLLSNGQAEGIDYAKAALVQNPRSSAAYRYLILAYGQLKDEVNLEKYKAEALKIDPFNPELK